MSGVRAVFAVLLVGLLSGASALGSGRAERDAEPPNLGRVKAAVREFYGDRVDAAGHHHASPDSPWGRQVAHEVGQARDHLAERLAAGVANPALVLEVEDTAELSYPLRADRDFAVDRRAVHEAVRAGSLPVIEPTRDLVVWAKQHGVRVFFVAALPEDAADGAVAGLRAHGYPEPDGFFTFPGEEPPSYLRCAARCTPLQYKTGTRAYLEQQGHTIVVNLGSQEVDLAGGHAERAVKLPNPMFFVP
ncbi:HAD superfamily, subfamily IIIB (Acid phosphatase) [Streptoalloteichus tenebrarius]|uniref:HAD superfamily, subfamily IIIB (Acid phosphatase) n=1 Tax=Streptoalloteichus tenebrarius (strain ATCC 17920 / DSM 40477 / JCM 4838 / CBS 697.72 / NBRC 16177 / NCIMB 11028 / NRRL B-12390 / A12253. 1 / ISP 5477) TaxID=1933 RepID=A0ABT1HWK0_STRSD|nr:HAD family acid phosphatase [Streptoalloteichus tenebrarius]MCP2259901.1 HAD superfamily, subfamily IIIB (Acid phosphatase) [Streptoalloteichus tenebrarius]BFF03226.1 HAD family acid phosphatase [Streptoalloteichus tenebrarius]